MSLEKPLNLNNISNLQTLENEVSLTVQEKAEFKKLPRAEQKKQNEEKLKELTALNAKQIKIIKEATETGDQGKLEEVSKIKEQIEKGIKDLEQQIEVTEHPELPEGAIIMEIIPDPEIISGETAITKLEAEGHKITDSSKYMLIKIDWKETLKSSYEIVSISIGELFGDKKDHTYADIKTKAQEKGLDLVPARLAPEIRLNYPKDGDWANIAMEARRDRAGYLALFRCSSRASDSWLGSGSSGSDDNKWGEDNHFFFVRK